MFFDKNEVEGNNQTDSSSKVIWFVSFVFLITVTIVLYFLFGTSTNSDLNQPLAESPLPADNFNKNFREAERLLNADNMEAAKPFYTEALKYASTPVEISSAQYKLSLTETQTDPVSAVARLKGIIEDEVNTDLDRAYAAQRLGLLYYRNSDPSLLPIIFSGEPYAGFYDKNDVFLSLRKIFEYSSSFYPVALSELRAAIWYAQAIANDPSLADAYLPIVETKLTNADLDIERTRYVSGPDVLINEALALKARVYAALHRSGYDYDYETAMQEAITTALASGNTGTDGPARYAYILNLFLYEEGREADIINLLQPMVTNINDYPAFKRMFERERNNVLNQKKDLVALGEAVPQFKKLLLSLGWTEADFN